MKDEREIKLLICSANLGNAQPDETSLNYLIPENGSCREVLEGPQKYPMRRMEETNTTSKDESDMVGEAYYDDTDQFDIIVFGMQESTFDPPKGSTTPSNNSAIDLDAMDRSTRSNKSGGGGGMGVKKTLSTIHTHTGKTLSTIQTHTGKTLSTIQTLAANRDYSSHQNTEMVGPQQWLGGTHVLHAMLAKRLPSYRRAVSFQRGEMRLVVLVNTERVKVSVVHVSAQNTGRGGFSNKGGIVAEILVDGKTRLAFLTAHLEAHEGATKYQTRVSTIADILAGTKDKQHDCSITSHYSFVIGDLNFRTELPNHQVLGEAEHKRIVRDMVARKDWEALNNIDELHRAIRNKDCLAGFQTLFCNFPPTFKVERQAGYEFIDKRRPSYTDRILWKTNNGLDKELSPLIYEPIDEFASSDHKPIRAAFAVKLNKPFCLRPRMARRRSVVNFGGILHKKKDKSQVVAHKERFHLFVSEMTCEVYSKAKSRLGNGLVDLNSSTPNPYICLISDPPEALQQKVKKGWGRVQQALKTTFVLRAHRRTMTSFLTAKGYPRSSIHKQTYFANWHEEEIHSEVKTHCSDGSPIDLTGAMLRLTVMDSRTSSDDIVVGTCAFNLVNLIRACRPSTGESSRHVLAKRGSKSKEATMGGVSSSLLRSQQRMSLMNLFRRSDQVVEEDPNFTDDPIETVEIDEPIVKNGVETGRIRCKIEAWWMDEATAKAFGGSIPFSLGSSSNNNRMSTTNGKGRNAERGNTMLSERRKRGGSADSRGSPRLLRRKTRKSTRNE